MTIRSVIRLTTPQIKHGLERLDDKTVDGLKRDLARPSRQDEAFVDSVQGRLAKNHLDVKSASSEELLRAVSLELAKVERAVATSRVREDGETLDLKTVEKRFGKTVRALLVALEELPHIPGRLDAKGKVRITEAVAEEVAEVYGRLKLEATDDAVVHEMHKVYATFDEGTLDRLHRAFHELLPDRRELASARALAKLEDEARVVAHIITKQGVTEHRELVKAMKLLGYADFSESRIAYLRERVPGVIPSTSEEHTPEEYEALSERIDTFIRKHPAATAKVLARALREPVSFVEETAELYGITLSKTRSARVMDPYDPLCDVLVRRALDERGPKDTIADVAERLSSNKAFTKRFGKVNGEQLERYVKEYLPKQLRPPKRRAPGSDAKPGVYDRAFAEKLSAYYDNPHITEPDVLAAARAFDPKVTKYRLKKLRAAFPDVRLTVRRHDEEERREIARTFGRLLKQHPDESYAQIIDRAVKEHGLPRVEVQYIGWLRDEFPRLIPKRIDRQTEDELKQTEERVAAYLKEHPHAKLAEVADALGLREAQLVKPVRRFRDEELDAGQTRYSAADRALIERIVRGAEPGDTLGDIQKKILGDPTFKKRHADVSVNTIRGTIVELVPEAADWKVYNLVNVARVLDEAAQKWPEGKSLSKLVASIKKKHPGFPSYVTLLASTVKSFKKHLDEMPFLEKYLADDGKFYFTGKKQEAVLSEELAEIVGNAFAEAPASWNNERIFAELHEDPALKKKYPVLNESTLTGLRRKFPGVIPARTSKGKDEEDQRVDAKRLAAEMKATLKRGEKIKLNEIAERWDVDPQYFRRVIKNHADLFPMYKKRYEITPHIARLLAHAISTLPMGVTIEEAADLVEQTGLLPPDMKVGKTTLINAERLYPDVVPRIADRNEQLFLRYLARELCCAPEGTTLKDIFTRAKEETGEAIVSYERFRQEIVPAWEKAKKGERPAYVDAILVAGKVTPTALGKPKSAFPVEDNADVERDLAQLRQIPPRLEMLERIVQSKARNAFADFNVLNIQHLLGSNYRFIEATHRLGAKKEDILTVGIPYSTSPTVARTLNERGLVTFAPPLNIAAWARQVEDAIFELIEKSKKNKKRIVVFDDGGLVSKILHERPWAKEHRHLFSIVEQTTRGITVAKKYDLEVPIINYAQDPAKDLEGVMIGEVVLDRLYKRLDGVGKRKALKGMKVTTVGAGTIGLPTAIELAKAGAKVRIYDLDPAARKRAAAEAKKHKVDIEVVSEPEAAFKGAEMIVGCTGHTSIGKEAFAHMADGCLLASTSSKLVEIDMALLDQKARDDGELQREVVDDGNRPPTCHYKLDDGRTITVFADGFPVNFDGAVNCVDPEDIQLTHAGMLLSGIQATWKDLPHGLVPFDDDLREELVRDWREVKAAREKQKG